MIIFLFFFSFSVYTFQSAVADTYVREAALAFTGEFNFVPEGAWSAAAQARERIEAAAAEAAQQATPTSSA